MSAPANTPAHGAPHAYATPAPAKTKTKSVGCAYVLCILLGAHRCYLSDPVGCIIYWLTGGLCWVMAILDLVNMDLLVKTAEHGLDLPILALKSKFPPAIQMMH